ncbi:MAG: Fic family protein [Flavihumibacter sp.]|nr:Fic family protein [Flavihumibacter sp.]
MASSEQIRKDFQQILHALSGEAEGLPIEALEARLTNPPDRRTLQRRLKELLLNGDIESFGKSRAVRYKLPANSVVEEPEFAESDIMPLSKTSKEILRLIMQPAEKRTPVGYNRKFLESYEPNRSSYLTTEEKEKLAGLGLTSQMNAAAGTYARQMLERLLIDLSWNSSRLEGNTYSLLETQRLLDKGMLAGEKSAAEAQMLLNHKDAIEFLVADSPDIGFNHYTILSLHALLSNNLLPNPASSGALRKHSVGIAGSVEEMFELLLEKAASIEDPFEQAFFVMVQLPYLQPFEDVNKRVSRLAANIPLNKKNLAPLSFVEVPDQLYINGLLGVYELNRVDLLKDLFLWAYERSAKQYVAQRQTLGEPDPFRMKYRDSIRAIVAEIITKPYTKEEAIQLIKVRSGSLPKADQERFVYTVETELISLHEGNFARYFVTPLQNKNWREVWD